MDVSVAQEKDPVGNRRIVEEISASVDPAEAERMRTIEIDAGKWTTVLDFLLALKAALGSLEWHGSGPDAFIDSMIWGGINNVEPPIG